MGKHELIEKIKKNDVLLESATFDNAHFSSEEIQELCTGLKANTHLKYLHLGYTHFPRPSVLFLSQALAENKTLVYLSMDEFEDDSAEVKTALRNIRECIQRNEGNGSENGYHT